MPQIIATTKYMVKDYVNYQKKYRMNPRESDKIMISLLHEHVADIKDKVLLDIGCHNGNLLYFIKHQFPGLRLKGGDLFQEVLDRNVTDLDLEGIEFEIMDVIDLQCTPVDIIVINAVLFRFGDHQYMQAWESIYRTLNPGGYVFVFDLINPFSQLLRIVEETTEHPEGLMLHFRPQKAVYDLMRTIGYDAINFYPFQIPIDLPIVDSKSAHVSYTKSLSTGERLLFRGALYQPWCHMVAEKP